MDKKIKIISLIKKINKINSDIRSSDISFEATKRIQDNHTGPYLKKLAGLMSASEFETLRTWWMASF